MKCTFKKTKEVFDFIQIKVDDQGYFTDTTKEFLTEFNTQLNSNESINDIQTRAVSTGIEALELTINGYSTTIYVNEYFILSDTNKKPVVISIISEERFKKFYKETL